MYLARANGGCACAGRPSLCLQLPHEPVLHGLQGPLPRSCRPCMPHLCLVRLRVRLCAHTKLDTNIDEYQSIKYKFQGGLPVAGQVQDCAGFGLGRVWRTRTQRSPHHILHGFLSHTLHAPAQAALACASSVADWRAPAVDVAGETGADGRPHSLMLYSPCRTVMVLAKVHE